MKSILETCIPRPDLLTGAFNPEIFTASLSQVMTHYRGGAGQVSSLYTDAERFFSEATFPTDGLRMLLSEVLARLGGDNGVPAIYRLETAFGGGKTHALIALIHLGFFGAYIAEVARDCLDTQMVDPETLHEPGTVQVVGIAGDEIPVHPPQGETLTPYTLWGEIALQIGGEALYRQVETDANSRAAPGKAFLDRVFADRKVLLLLDELAQYAARLAAAHAQGADQLAAFLMALAGYARTHSNMVVVVTLASQTDAFATQTETLAGLLSAIRGEAVTQEEAAAMAQTAQAGVLSVVSRDATGVVPVQANEISRVLTRRLFLSVDRTAGAETVDAYWNLYRKTADLLPDRASREDYRATMRDLYPFHPTFVEFLNQKMATLANFQGTRGVLRVLALAVRSLWEKGQAVPMIQTCHLNLRDARIVNELIGRTGGGELLPILNTDIGGVDTGTLTGGTSRAGLADRRHPHPEGHPFHEYAWKTVFLHSLVGRHEGLGTPLFGINLRDALLEISFPGLAPSQVEAALKTIEDSDRGAFYLRYSKAFGRYYASLDASINRALAAIRSRLDKTQVADFLDVAARKIVRPDTTFQVAQDVTLPEHIKDRTGRPTLGLVALGADQIDVDAFVTTVGTNRPRIEQNLVMLLVPRTVRVQGEIWSDERVISNREARRRLENLARDVIARNLLLAAPDHHGIRPKQLDEEEFERKTRERDLALQTVITQHYDGLWYPSASGQIVRKAIHTAGGESGAAVIAEIHRVLYEDGELITAERARTQECINLLGRLFFSLGQTPTCEQLRAGFAIDRRWPMLEARTVFDQIIREGVARGAWCLFQFADEHHTRPDVIDSRDTEALPPELDLRTPGWAIVTPSGARQRGWLGGPTNPDPALVESWVAEAIQRQPAAYVAQIIDQVVDAHGEIAESDILIAIEQVIHDEQALAYSGSPEQDEAPDDLMHGATAILYAVGKTDVILSPAEASRRGWIQSAPRHLELQGREAAARLLPLLGRLGGFYERGASSTLDVLDLTDLRLPGGGRLRLLLQDCPPADMKRLGELLEVLSGLVTPASQPLAQAHLRITGPRDECPLVKALEQD
ncbi:ATP-binding protein [Thiobaca trueperi]|uniref:Uncharacterized protein DUF499 n=1 Tax=Thiobaca trueperi TaxID=127458 RepID=A0A4R3MZ45_9GAMM|nr:DUF499 domain-containing protein [Thiobaca trueperi]TCT21968.1 uncharacterized protein DUF499 [Thiobaca trueperi]